MSDSLKAGFSATKILLPIDFSPSSEAALEAAAGLALQFHAGVHLVHIIPEIPNFNGSDFFPETTVLEERREVVEQALEVCKARLVLQGIDASFSVETGNDIVGSLMRVIRIQGADMVVISTHGLSGWRPFLVGSIAEQLIKQVGCPLLLIQSPHPVAEQPAIEVWEETFVVSHGKNMKPLGLVAPSRDELARRRLDESAEALAERGERTEQQYDQSHSLFTK
jgi:nucleotide-binding universal stress UspA family protein